MSYMLRSTDDGVWRLANRAIDPYPPASTPTAAPLCYDCGKNKPLPLTVEIEGAKFGLPLTRRVCISCGAKRRQLAAGKRWKTMEPTPEATASTGGPYTAAQAAKILRRSQPFIWKHAQANNIGYPAPIPEKRPPGRLSLTMKLFTEKDLLKLAEISGQRRRVQKKRRHQQ